MNKQTERNIQKLKVYLTKKKKEVVNKEKTKKDGRVD